MISFTVENTYDAYVHMFFADHYSGQWFETWNYKWYTGFTMTSYPPLVHHVIALLSKWVGLKIGFLLWGLVAVVLFIRGVYHFSLIWVSPLAASYASLVAVVSSSYIEALHLFGQLPSITGMALLLNACPVVYQWIRYNKTAKFFLGISTLACVTAAHHVTTIFGMVFFILPVMGVAVLDICIEEQKGIQNVRLKDFFLKVVRLLPKAIVFGLTVITLTVVVLFPYWYWSKTDPITQVSIPHGSRASFIEQPMLGLVFFVIPWGIMLFFLPPIIFRLLKKRNLFLGLSFLLLILLGSGGTTPLPKMMLGENAFNILTLDRFTFWGSIIALPFFGSVLLSLLEGNIRKALLDYLPNWIHKFTVYFTVLSLILTAVLVINFSQFKPIQPKKIDIEPIVNFLNSDGHDAWRYLTLGFGDQMAWLSAHTDALTVDGNYHSARRLPELTTRAVERLENSKYLGIEGIGALQQFLCAPEKYHLKYVFSNDKFYEPLLYFSGWTNLGPLANNIVVWERKDITPLPSILPKKDIPTIQKYMWGILPLSCLFLFIIFMVVDRFRMSVFNAKRKELNPAVPSYKSGKYLKIIYILWFLFVSIIVVGRIFYLSSKLDPQQNPQQLIQSYMHQIDFKQFPKAYSLLDPETKPDIDQFILELSLEDGMLASYAKLDRWEVIQENKINESETVITIKAHWITAVKAYSSEHEMRCINRDKKWFLKHNTFEKAIPMDAFISMPEVDFHSQGRRKADHKNTDKADILDRPEVYIIESNLIQNKDQYHIVGELMNMDNEPAYITIEAVLFDSVGQEIVTYHVNDVIVHNLMPKEKTFFRIDFEDVAWEQSQVKFPDSFDPEISNPYQFLSNPTSFVVFVKSTLTDERLHKLFGISDAFVSNDIIEGNLVNYGNHEIAIPQIITATTVDKSLVWAERHYLPKGIRPQREKDFSIEHIRDLPTIILRGNDENLLVNGVTRKEMIQSIDANVKFKRDHYVQLRSENQIIYLQANAYVSFKN